MLGVMMRVTRDEASRAPCCRPRRRALDSGEGGPSPRLGARLTDVLLVFRVQQRLLHLRRLEHERHEHARPRSAGGRATRRARSAVGRRWRAPVTPNSTQSDAKLAEAQPPYNTAETCCLSFVGWSLNQKPRDASSSRWFVESVQLAHACVYGAGVDACLYVNVSIQCNRGQIVRPLASAFVARVDRCGRVTPLRLRDACTAHRRRPHGRVIVCAPVCVFLLSVPLFAVRRRRRSSLPPLLCFVVSDGSVRALSERWARHNHQPTDQRAPVACTERRASHAAREPRQPSDQEADTRTTTARGTRPTKEREGTRTPRRRRWALSSPSTRAARGARAAGPDAPTPRPAPCTAGATTRRDVRRSGGARSRSSRRRLTRPPRRSASTRRRHARRDDERRRPWPSSLQVSKRHARARRLRGAGGEGRSRARRAS